MKNCTNCEYWKKLKSSLKGVRIPGSFGKCIRPSGHCEPEIVNIGFGNRKIGRIRFL